MDGDEFFVGFFIMMGVFVFGIFLGTIIESHDIGISQETGDDICKNLTGNQSAVAYEIFEDNYRTGKLGCDIPSYDSTQNIIIKKNNE